MIADTITTDEVPRAGSRGERGRGARYADDDFRDDGQMRLREDRSRPQAPEVCDVAGQVQPAGADPGGFGIWQPSYAEVTVLLQDRCG